MAFAWNYDDPETAKGLREIAHSMAGGPRPPPEPELPTDDPDHQPSHLSALMRQCQAAANRRPS